MKFQYYKPAIHLQHFIAYYWTLTEEESDQQVGNYRFVPDGMVDWVFHLGIPWQCNFSNIKSHTTTPRFHVFGQIKNYVDLDISRGDLNVFGVKFYPWMANQICSADMHYLTDNSIGLDDLGLLGIKMLSEKIIGSKTLEGRIRTIENYFSNVMSDFNSDHLGMVFKSFEHLPSDLALHKLNVSKRRLEQRFKNEIGLSPNHYNKIMRINRVILDLKTGASRLLTQLALNHGFYDQSHFVKDFKQFTGYSPKRFLESIHPDGDILNLRAT
ncbi:AraC family transcriptional regulator [Winogradskyella sp.]|uniref:AraC family transcriptional regulator n=1 Tax=Winogradskyella sp. TaxID=1883156 RepID=UPI003BAC1C83